MTIRPATPDALVDLSGASDGVRRLYDTLGYRSHALLRRKGHP